MIANKTTKGERRRVLRTSRGIFHSKVTMPTTMAMVIVQGGIDGTIAALMAIARAVLVVIPCARVAVEHLCGA